MLPLNLAHGCKSADYLETGHWSRRAIAEALPSIDVRIAARGDGITLPPPNAWDVSPSAAYCHLTSNETADGLQYHCVPDTGNVPLVADMSADLLTRPVDMERYGLIYASGQKNLGAAGLTVVIVRADLLGHARPGTPAPFDYTRQAAEKSKVNTPPTFAIAVALRMLHWLEDQGGLVAAEARSRRKAENLYSIIGHSGFYSSPIVTEDRSLVSVRFHLASDALTEAFVDEAARNGLIHLRGHPEIGGLRANLYNGVSEEDVGRLVDFMIEFRRRRR
jgi:phosphoserine aminotransferase